MRRRLVLLAPVAAVAASCAPQPAPSATPTVVVFFTQDSARLDDPAQAAITQAAAIARANPGVVHVRGFAAPDMGTAAFNKSLAQTRAQAVADGLVAAGVQPGRIRMESRGATPYEDMPRESRRVEIVVGG